MSDGVDDVNVDELLQQMEEPGEPRAMEGGEAQEAPAAPAPVEQAPWWSGVEFDWNGKKIKPEREEQARTWISQGYNYAQRMGELNKTHAQKLAEVETDRQKVAKYLAVDEYAGKNPEWWAYVEQQFAAKDQQRHRLDPNIAQALNPLQSELAEVKSFVNSLKEQREQEKFKAEDSALDQEIESIRKQNPNIDLSAADESGKPLEIRVLEHAKQIGTRSFRAAFRDYLHDQLVEHAKANGREAIAKDTAAKAKKGLLGTSSTPVKGAQPATNVRGKSYDSLAKEALAEFGIN